MVEFKYRRQDVIDSWWLTMVDAGLTIELPNGAITYIWRR